MSTTLHIHVISHWNIQCTVHVYVNKVTIQYSNYLSPTVSIVYNIVTPVLYGEFSLTYNVHCTCI